MNEFKDDLDLILKILDISESELARQLGFDTPTISNWLKGKFDADQRSKEDIYSYAYNNGLRINKAHEKPFENLGKKQGFIVLYHGSKKGIDSEIDLNHSEDNNDFSKGFYLGETLSQSSIFVSDYHDSHIYAYGLYPKNLKIYEFGIDIEWAITIAYNRHKLNDYKNSEKLKKIINKSKDYDVIIAPIADNRMFDIIDEFVNGLITDEALIFGLSALHLGKQYVLKTNKAIDKLGFLKEFYMCKQEKLDYIKEKNILQKNRMENIKNFRSKNRKGNYIDDIL